MKTLEKIIQEYFDPIAEIISVDLFGSYAQNRQSDKSDVDIAILCDRNSIPDPLKQISWREDLSDLLQKEIDLVCLNTASPIIGMQVEQTRKNLLLKNPREYANYQMALYTDYAELKEWRAPMEKDILKRKYYD